jgi:hypothetical protein
MIAGVGAVAAAAAWPAAAVAVTAYGGYKLYTSATVRGWTSDLVKKTRGR